jgi:chromosome segregation ATPase
VLTKKLQSELEILSKKVASLDQQVSFRVHVVSDLVEEVLSRWRSSTSLALHTISSLEQELARKTEALREAHARSADREATLASSDAEKEAIRVYATRLEEHLGRLVEASVAAVNTASADANAIPLQKPIIAALQQLMSETSNSKAVPHISASSASSSSTF